MMNGLLIMVGGDFSQSHPRVIQSLTHLTRGCGSRSTDVKITLIFMIFISLFHDVHVLEILRRPTSVEWINHQHPQQNLMHGSSYGSGITLAISHCRLELPH